MKSMDELLSDLEQISKSLIDSSHGEPWCAACRPVVALLPEDFTAVADEYEKRGRDCLAWLQAEFRATAESEPSDEYYLAWLRHQLWELGAEPDRADPLAEVPF